MYQHQLIMCSATLLIATLHAQAQSVKPQNDISDLDFRQTLIDLGSYLDSHKGTDLRRQFEAIPEDYLRQMHSAVANPLQLQGAVAALKKHDADLAAERLTRAAAVTAASPDPMAAFPSCPPNTIIDTSPGSPCTPAYADPNNTSWRAMVTPLIVAGAFSPSDYTSVSPQACGLTTEVNLQQVTVAMQGLYNSLTPACSIIPAPVNATCWGPLILVAVADSISAGLFSDCVEQDNLVNAAEIDAGFHNTVTIYNSLKGVDTHLTNVDTDIDTRIGNLSTQITNVNSQISSEFTALDTHLTNVDNHVAAEFTALGSQLTTLFNQLTNQVSQATVLLSADQKQVMKLLLEPDGLKAINPAILTCTGSNCPNVLANCPAAGCTWNNIGPLP